MSKHITNRGVSTNNFLVTKNTFNLYFPSFCYVLQIECWVCKEKDHMSRDCIWRNFSCVDGCPSTMRVFVSKTVGNYDRKFLRCKAQPRCNGFKWMDEVDVQELQKGKGAAKIENVGDVNKDKDNVKLHINGKIAMSVEGSVENICKLVKKLELNE
jgi:hypothetical protein